MKEQVSRLERQLAADRKRKIAPPFLKRQQDHIAAVRKSQNGPRQDIGNVGKEIRKIQARITESRPAPQERFKGAAGVRILDAWGLPVATVTPHVVLERKKVKE